MNKLGKSDVKLVLIGGGSYGWTYRFITDIACIPELHGMHIILHDIDSGALELVKSLCDKIMDAMNVELRIETSTKLESCLPGTDFVGLTISTGGDDANVFDMSIPAKYGIIQTVADTVGPGGWSRALRNIPVVVDIIRKVEKYAPNAWFMNYSNPMTILTRTLQKVSPVKSVGLCHELQGLFLHIAAFLGLDDWENDIKVKMAGINHLIWIMQINIHGQNGFDLLKKYHQEHPDFEYVVKDKVPEDLIYSGGVNSKQKIKFDFLERTGCLPAAGDAHIAEFFSHFLADQNTADRWEVGNHIHTFSYQKGVERRKKRAQRLLSGEEALWLKHSHEHASKIIAALSGGKELITPVNTANIGQIDNLPRNVVVESQAYVDRLGIQPIPVGCMPDILVQYLMRHIPIQEMTVEAGLTGSRDLAIQALSCDPLIPNPDIAVKVANEFFCKFENYLPQFYGKWKT
ncbi:MAG: family 4 glycosyl hydrolase [Sedimentisphaerales bacterium]